MTEAQKKAIEKFNKLNPEKSKEYRKRYYEKHKEEILAKKREYERQNKEKMIEFRKSYYLKNKETINAKNKEYVKNNRKKVSDRTLARRKEVAEELKQKGMIYTYLPKTQREEKTVTSLANKLNISEEEARVKLVANDWNYYGILERYNA
jgi:hypothetical protein